MQGVWLSALRRGLLQWSTLTHSHEAAGVNVEFLAPRSPILFLSGATPGPFYHSHPHDPREFDHLALPRTVNGTGHTGPSEFCATSP